MNDYCIEIAKKFGLPEIPSCKKYINDFLTPEIIAITKCKDNINLEEEDVNVLKEAIQFYKVLFPALLKINLVTLTLDEAQVLMKYLHFIFNILLIQQRDHKFHFLYRVVIIKDVNREKGKIRNPSLLSFPPLSKVQEKKVFNRCNTFKTTLFYASFFENVALLEMKPKKGEKIIISTWQNTRPERKFVFFEIPNADVNNISVIEAKEAYKKALEGKNALYQELLNLTTAFIASEFVKEVNENEGYRNPNRLEYLFSAFISNRLFKAPPNNDEILPNDLIMYPSVPWKHVHDNVAMDPKTHKLFKLTKAVEYLVEDTFYNKPNLELAEMPAKLAPIRESYLITEDDIIWEDD